MRTKTQKRRKLPANNQNNLWRYLFLIAVGIALLAFFLSGPRGTIRLIEQKKEKDRLLKEIEELEKTKAALDSEKVKLHQDEYIEKIAREQYNMKKEGEKVYRIEIEEKEEK